MNPQHTRLVIPALRSTCLVIACLLSLPAIGAPADGQNAASPATQIDTLTNQADQLFEEKNYTAALALYQQVLAAKRAAGERLDETTATALGDVGRTLFKLARYTEAEAHLRQALATAEQALGSDHPDAATHLTNLALFLRDVGRPAEAEPLLRRALAIGEATPGTSPATIGLRLNNLAGLLRAAGRYAEAEEIYRRALAIAEQESGGDSPQVALRLNNLALLLQETGRYGEAETAFSRALKILEASRGADHGDTATMRNNLAGLLRRIGRYADAEKHYRDALAIDEKIYRADHPEIGTDCNNLALVLKETGQLAEAEALARRALAIGERTRGADHPSVAIRASNLAGILRAAGRNADAEALYRRALAIDEKYYAPDHPAIASDLNNLALLLAADRPDEALALYRRAWRLGLSAGTPELLWKLNGNLSRFYAQRAPDVAIFFGKHAVNTLQRLRANLKASSREGYQKAFLGTADSVYHELAELLIEQGRLAEAREVLKHLKEDEYRDFIRGQIGPDAPVSRLPYSRAEQSWAEQEEALAAESLRLADEHRARQAQSVAGNDASATAPQPELVDLAARREQLGQGFEAWFAGVVEQLPTDAQRLAADERRQQDAALAQARRQIADLGGQAALLEYLLVGNRVHIMLTTAQQSVVRRVTIDGRDIGKQLIEFRVALSTQALDPRPAAQALYRDLIGPVAADLEAGQIDHLLLSLEGALRYIPFAALHDGEHYLVERYALSLHTAAVSGTRAKHSGVPSRLAAFGSTRAHAGFPALPNVQQEIDLLRKSGKLSAEVYLDDQFTAERLRQSLKQSYPLLHIASHFRFVAGNESDSFLLLGDGNRLPLMTLRQGDYSFAGVDLLALSACETALHGGRTADGREVEGFAVLAQNKGAQNVLATLWEVADLTTPEVMRAFYLARAGGKSKAAALREAQQGLLSGKLKPTPVYTTGIRGGSGVRAIAATNSFTADPRSPFSHPYYWAPFILFGDAS
ncbi:tetratricopeptide repeat protein [Candidatus Accumulibacter vicinus]|uniref:Type IV pilus biogenesis/stability protein PilW n=1 Tax=Candidatus Accumulibacter vicinus TaxID=2954382 RepID=A0A084Y088_9PROT|nr:tetratricopeptide repeat protein [Candidatus Accumulibacter vicinus]KFB68132.1 MAG: type IV pilus biogenesis/stability protein PilW [Candidatus Accumulibacter vicinus]